jgi:hypothetical protein
MTLQPTQCPISKWADSEIAKHSSPVNLAEREIAKVAVPLLKRFKTRLSKPAKDPLAFTKDPKFQSMNSAKFAAGDWRLSVRWGGQWVNSSGKTFNECITKLGRMLK